MPAEGDAEAIAKVAWDTYTNDIDQLEVIVNGRAALVADKAELEQMFGARDSSLSAGGDTDTESGLSNGTAVLIAVSVALVVAGGLTGGLIVLSNRRLRRSRTP